MIKTLDIYCSITSENLVSCLAAFSLFYLWVRCFPAVHGEDHAGADPYSTTCGGPHILKSRFALKKAAACGKKSNWSVGKLWGGRSSRDKVVESDQNSHFSSTWATEGGGSKARGGIVGNARVKLSLGRRKDENIEKNNLFLLQGYLLSWYWWVFLCQCINTKGQLTTKLKN